MLKRTLVILALGIVLATLGMTTARAWPDMPPEKAVLSGPGIEGEVEITDPNVLLVLRLGGLEDMNWGAIDKPKLSGEGFKIIRYFEGGTFRMGDLTYYPNAAGSRSAVYFDDGPMKNGDKSPFDDKWLYATTGGDAVMLKHLKQLGATLPEQPDSAISNGILSAMADPLPTEIRTGVPVTLWFTLNVNHKLAQVVLAREGSRQKTIVSANAGEAPGRYFFNYVFPDAGTWNWSVGELGREMDVPMPSLTVVDTESLASAPVQPAAKQDNSSSQANSPTPGEPGDASSSVKAPTRPAIDGTTVLMAVAAGLLGIVGIGAALGWQRSKKQ